MRFGRFCVCDPKADWWFGLREKLVGSKGVGGCWKVKVVGSWADFDYVSIWVNAGLNVSGSR
jgi:hypothetical protein